MRDFQQLSQYKLPYTASICQKLRFAAWYFTGRLLIACFIPGTWWRKSILRLFGARIGHGGRFKPRLMISCPWMLSVGDHCWIGENVWIDNLAPVVIGNNVCLSQGSYFCPGNHDYRKSTFDLRLSSITVESEAWIAAYSVLAPGTHVCSGAVVALASVVSGQIPSGVIVRGNPAKIVGVR